jgi:hypothetical protein
MVTMGDGEALAEYALRGGSSPASTIRNHPAAKIV